MAYGMAGWSLGQLVWSYYQIFGGDSLPSPSLADVGYLTLPVFALPALLSLAAAATRPGRLHAPRRGRAGARRPDCRGLAADPDLGDRARVRGARGSAERAGVRGRHRLPDHRSDPRGDRRPADLDPAGAAPVPPAAVPARRGPGGAVGFRQHLRLPGLQRGAGDAAAGQRRVRGRPGADRRGRLRHRPGPHPGPRPGGAPRAVAAPAAAVRAGDGDGGADPRADHLRSPARHAGGLAGLAGARPGRGPADDHPGRQHGAAGPGLRWPAAAGVPGVPRLADRAGQPGAVPRAARPRGRPAPDQRPPAGAALRRPGRLQARQRQPRALHRRPAAAGRGRAAGRLRTPGRPGGAARRGRVRGAPGGRPLPARAGRGATSSPRCAPRSWSTRTPCAWAPASVW